VKIKIGVIRASDEQFPKEAIDLLMISYSLNILLPASSLESL
jgi:hypothetical protein